MWDQTSMTHFSLYPAGQGRTTYRTLEISGKDTLDRLCELILEEIHI
jgi:hypothetical protein